MAPRLFAFLLCSAVVVVGSVVPAKAHAETLITAVEDALNQHPSVQAALAGRDIAKAQRREAASPFYPELNINAATGRVYADNSTSRGLTVDRGAGYSWSTEGGITMRQMIFDGMETGNRVDAARAMLDSANMNVIDVRENLGLRVVLAYLEVLRTREAVTLLREHGKKIADYRTRIQAMVEQGAADESMAVQAHDIQNQLDGTIADVEGQQKKALAEYAEAVGRPIAEPLERPVFDESAILPDENLAVAKARAEHPALHVATLRGVAAHEGIRAEKGTLYPDLSGEVSMYKKDIDDVIGGEVVDNRALLRMNWDFSTGGAQLARIKQSVHREAEAQAQAVDLAGKIEREIRKSYAELDAAQKRLAVSRDRVKVSDDLVRTYEIQFEAAKVTLLNLLQAENTSFNAKLGVLNADYRHLAAQYSVLANMGALQKTLRVEPVDLAGAPMKTATDLQ
jgi:adhesin transport system outer membrane protein